MKLWAGLMLAGLLWGQEPGVLLGTLIERDETPAGEIAVRGPGNRVVRLHYDAKTYMEREGRLALMRDLHAGDTVEVVVDQPRYARSVKVVTAMAPRPRPRPLRRPARTPFLDETFPRGNLFFSGTISEVAPESLVVRTREHGLQRILLRGDTQYLANGGQAAASELKVNTRVFVRAGKNYAGEVEAYRVVWGAILHPRD